MFVKNSYIIVSFLLSFFLSNLNSNQIKEEQLATLIIPKISLEEIIYRKESKYNNLKYGLYLAPESTSINDENSNIIIASHSGNAKVSYFKNLDKLRINDEIRLIYNKDIYLYRVVNIYEEEKDGIISINKYNKNTLTLVTCKKNSNTLHLIVSAVYCGKLGKND